LVLLDEPFAGTDPAQGGALTMALLERLYIAGATVVVTTHLDRVKAFALEYPWLCNASVEFDLNAMRPSYRLRIGTPGGSAALAIAARLGMPAELLSRAEQLHREEAKSGLENALGKLENERVALEDERKLLATSRSQMQARSEQLAGEIEKVKRRELQVLSSDSVELRRRLRELRKRIREFEARIAEAKLEKAAEAKALERELRPLEQEARETHAVIRQSHGSKLVPLPKEAVRQGLGVMSRRYEREATIVEVFAEHVLLQLGALKVQVPYDDLAVSPNAAKERSDAKPAKATPRPSSSRQQSTAAAPPAPPIVIPHPENTIDLRGMNRDEAIERVEFFLDSALRKELSGICVIHGHGTGVLKAAVRSFLPKSPYVSSCWPGSREEGGDGVTLARLRDR
jgi:DNA mismatch repair protein MutS2